MDKNEITSAVETAENRLGAADTEDAPIGLDETPNETTDDWGEDDWDDDQNDNRDSGKDDDQDDWDDGKDDNQDNGKDDDQDDWDDGKDDGKDSGKDDDQDDRDNGKDDGKDSGKDHNQDDRDNGKDNNRDNGRDDDQDNDQDDGQDDGQAAAAPSPDTLFPPDSQDALLGSLRRLRGLFPDVQEMPQEVTRAIQKGQDAVAAYASYRIRQDAETVRSLREKIAVLEQNAANQARAVVRGVAGETGQKAKDPWLEGFDSYQW